MASLSAKQRSSLLQGLKDTCRLFWGPDRDLCRELLEGRYFNDLEDLDPLLENMKDRRTALQNSTREYPDEGALYQAMEEEYVYLFISRKGGVGTPLYHSCYMAERASLMGPPALRMIDRFRAAGLHLADDLKEPPDHIAIEGEYVYFLLEKGWRENARKDLQEAGDFVAKDMLPWVEVFKKKLAEEPEGIFYVLITGIFCDLLQIIADLLLERTGTRP